MCQFTTGMCRHLNKEWCRQRFPKHGVCAACTNTLQRGVAFHGCHCVLSCPGRKHDLVGYVTAHAPDCHHKEGEDASSGIQMSKVHLFLQLGLESTPGFISPKGNPLLPLSGPASLLIYTCYKRDAGIKVIQVRCPLYQLLQLPSPFHSLKVILVAKEVSVDQYTSSVNAGTFQNLPYALSQSFRRDFLISCSSRRLDTAHHF